IRWHTVLGGKADGHHQHNRFEQAHDQTQTNAQVWDICTENIDAGIAEGMQQSEYANPEEPTTQDEKKYIACERKGMPAYGSHQKEHRRTDNLRTRMK